MEENSNIETADSIIIEDEQGNEKTYEIDAVIEMNHNKYVLYSDGEELLISQITHEGQEEYLENVTDEEMEELLSAYEQALKEEENTN